MFRVNDSLRGRGEASFQNVWPLQRCPFRSVPGREIVGLLILALAGCSGSGPTVNAPTMNPATAETPLTLSGTIVSTQDGTPVAGATATFNGATLTTVTTGPDGRFSIPVAAGLLRYSVVAAGYFDRASALTVVESRDNVQLDMIAEREPLSLEFYRQVARDWLNRRLTGLLPWPTDPSFYLVTTTRDTGEMVPEPIITAIRRVFENAIPELSGGRRKLAGFESGPAPRPSRDGWVEVTFWHYVGPGLTGTATVGYLGALGEMQLRYDPVGDAQGIYNPLECESASVETADHEIVHTMGFYHSDSTFDDFHSGPGCPGSGRPQRMRIAGAIMASRPRSNKDPDRDPTEFSTPAAVDSRPVRMLCRLDDIR